MHLVIVRQLKKPRYLLPLIVAILLIACLAAIRPMLMPSGNTEWVELAVVGLIVLAILLSLLPVLVTVVVGRVGGNPAHARPVEALVRTER